MDRALVWVPAEMEDALRVAPEFLEVVKIPEEPASSPRLEDVKLVITAPGGPALRDSFPKMTRLQVIQTSSAGVDGVIADIPEGVTLCSARGSYGVVAEWIVAAILSDFKAFPAFRDDQHQGKWNRRPVRRLAGKTVLIVGYGSIGQAVEEALRNFGAEFVRVARQVRPGVLAIEELPKVLPLADVIVLLVPLTSQTERLVDANFLAQMKEGALLVNAARGRVVDTEALLQALQRDRLTAVLDVTDPEPLPDHHPLFSMANVFITPHIAGGPLARQEVLGFLKKQLERFARDEPLLNVVLEGY